MPESGPIRPALIAGICTTITGALLTLTVWWMALRTHRGQLTDWMAFEGLITFLQQNDIQGVDTLLSNLRVLTMLILLLSATMLVVRRRQWLVAGQVLAIVVGASATGAIMSELGPSFFRPQALPAYPFTNSVDLMTVLLACAAVAVVMATRPGNRSIVAVLGAGLVGVLAAGQLVSYAQRPSMGVMAMLIVTTWTGLVVAMTAVARHRQLNVPPPSGPPATKANTGVGVLLLLLSGLAAAIAAAVLIVQWHAGTLPATGRYGYQILSFLGPALAVGATACLTMAANLVAIQAGDHSEGPTETPTTFRPGGDRSGKV